MAKHRNRGKKYYPTSRNRQDVIERQQKQELQEANHSLISEPEIAEEDIEDVDDGTNPQQIYVLDTNLIISCVNVIYDPDDETWYKPINFEPNLDNAHLVIPYTVFEELNHIKEEVSARGMMARIAFERLGKLLPNTGRQIIETMNLDNPIQTGLGDQCISILPLHRNFSRSLPFVPSQDDNDGWIAVTALAATMISEGIQVDGSVHMDKILARSNEAADVVLLTNDNQLRSKADLFAVRTSGYSFEKPAPYTGVREVEVPVELFDKFYYEGSHNGISRDEWESYMPDELPLVANEYIIMIPEGERYPRGYFTDQTQFKNIARYHADNDHLYPLRFAKREGTTPINEGIATYYDALNDDSIKVVIATGAAGTGKTFQAIIHAIKAAQEGKFSRIIVIPSSSAKNQLGALPGGEEQKMEPMIAFCKDAIEAYLTNTPEFKKKREELRRYGDVDTDEPRQDSYQEKQGKGKRRNDYQNGHRTRGSFTGSFDDLDYGNNDCQASDFGESHSKKKDKAYYPSKSDKKRANEDGKQTYAEMLEKQVNYIYRRFFMAKPYEQVQGRSFEDAIIILDEFQRVQIDDADTLVTRPAKHSKLIICGDIDQIHNSSAEKRFNNGLSYARESFFDWEGCANVHLTQNLRSDIARVATANRRKVRSRMGTI